MHSHAGAWERETRFLRTQVVEPNRITRYSYDEQGHLLSTQISDR
jgi:hypothetical protein